MDFKTKTPPAISYKITARTVEGYGRGADECRIIGAGKTFKDAVNDIKAAAAAIGQKIDASTAAVFEITKAGPREVLASTHYFN